MRYSAELISFYLFSRDFVRVVCNTTYNFQLPFCFEIKARNVILSATLWCCSQKWAPFNHFIDKIIMLKIAWCIKNYEPKWTKHFINCVIYENIQPIEKEREDKTFKIIFFLILLNKYSEFDVVFIFSSITHTLLVREVIKNAFFQNKNFTFDNFHYCICFKILKIYPANKFENLYATNWTENYNLCISVEIRQKGI